MYLRTRLALLLTLLVGVALAGAGIATYKLMRVGLLSEIERDVSRRAATFAGSHPAPPYNLDTFAAPDVFMQVVDPAATPVASSGNLGDRLLPLSDDVRAGRVVEAHVGGRPLYLTAAFLPDGGFVIVARSPVTIYAALSRLRQLLYLVAGAAVLAAGAVSWLVARGALRPVERVASAAAAVTRSRDLTQRVEYAGPSDEAGQLAATFNSMLAALQEATAQLDASNQRLRQFLADCAHELRAPLTLIVSNLDLLARVGPTDPGFGAKALGDIREEADRMARLITQLLILGRADAGAIMTPRPVALAGVVANAVHQSRAMADGVHVTDAAGDALSGVMVNGNPDYLTQLLLILLDNACKYTPAGGAVRVEAAADGPTVRLVIEDTGTGIDPGDVPRIFDRFYRGRNAAGTPGTGLGLAIAQWIVQQHGGRIAVDTTAGRGSRFTVFLPVLSRA
ncbi:MAG: HAMP domain-containing sensor histidine kinase [bacterium]